MPGIDKRLDELEGRLQAQYDGQLQRGAKLLRQLPPEQRQQAEAPLRKARGLIVEYLAKSAPTTAETRAAGEGVVACWAEVAALVPEFRHIKRTTMAIRAALEKCDRVKHARS